MLVINTFLHPNDRLDVTESRRSAAILPFNFGALVESRYLCENLSTIYKTSKRRPTRANPIERPKIKLENLRLVDLSAPIDGYMISDF